MKYILSYTLLLLTTLGFSQANMVPAPAQSESILLEGATLHLGNGEVIENGAIGFDKGLITFVGTANEAPSGFGKKVSITGKHVYPGLIAPNNQLGLIEIAGVSASIDASEIGPRNGHLKTQIAFNTDSHVIPTVRSMGVLLTEPVISNGETKGTSSIMHLDGWNWEDATYKEGVAFHLEWPSRFKKSGWWAEPGPTTKQSDYEEKVESLKMHFQAGKAYLNSSKPDAFNPRYDGMKGLFSGEKKLFIHVDFAPSMMEAVMFAEDLGAEVVLVGGHDAYMILDFLKEREVPIVLGTTQAVPVREDEPVDINFKLPSMLENAGILYAFGMDGYWEVRNLAYQAGQAVGYGLDKEMAIKALTSNTAKIYGIDNKTGTLMVGKDANIVVSAGNILDMRTSEVEHAFIQGRTIDLNNKQKQLYEKFKVKYQRSDK